MARTEPGHYDSRQESSFDYRGLVECAPDAIVITDSSGTIVLVNAQAEELFGYAREELLGERIDLLIPERDRGGDRDHRAGDPATRLRPISAGLELYARRKDGGELPVEIALSPLETQRGLLVCSAIRDVTERRREREHLRQLADHDALTGARNRRRFEEDLKSQLARCCRYGELAALLMIDIDSFKQLNDAYGHVAGDEALKGLAMTIRDHLRESDVLARIGGDEFAVLLPHADERRARVVAAVLRGAISARSVETSAGPRIGLEASIGVALLDQDAERASVLGAADRAMYRDKQERRGSWATPDGDWSFASSVGALA